MSFGAILISQMLVTRSVIGKRRGIAKGGEI